MCSSDLTDHHILGKKLPDALAIVNPQLVKAPTLYKTLSGAGVAFKFILALEQALDRPLPDSIVDFMLTIVAFGTLSDRMSMLNPMNRILVKRGVDALAVSKREGLKSLVRICVEMQGRLMPRMLSRTIIPRLNAPGRIGDPEKGIPDSSIVVDLLLTGIGRKNAKKASSIASIFQSVITLDKKVKEGLDTDSVAQAMTTALSVDDINEKRKFITNKIEEDIEHCIETQVDVMADRIIMVEGKGWNPGVIGIDTDRLKDRFLRPAVIFTFDEKSDYVRASIRSIPTIDMYGMIDAIDDAYQAKHGVSLFNVTVQTTQGERVICAFGGHSQACGLTIHKDKVPEFKALLRESAATLPTEIFNYYYDVIDKIPFSDLTEKFVTKLDAFAPYGQHFDYPIFYLQGCDLSKGKPFGNKYQDLRKPHVRFSVQEKSSKRKKRIRSIPAVGFGLWEKLCELRANHNSDVGFDLIFVCETMYKRKTNEYSVRLNVLDIRHSGQDNLSSH